MTAGRSLHQRLLAAAALWLALAVGGVGVLLVLLFRHHVEDELASRAQVQLDALAGQLALAAPQRLVLRREPPEPAFAQPLGGMYWLVQHAGDAAQAGETLRSRSWWDHPPPPLPQPAAVPADRALRLAATGPGGQPLVLWARRVELAGLDAPVVVAVGADATRLHGMTRSFARTVAIALAVLALALWGAAWLQVRSGLAPLHRLQGALRRLREAAAERVEGRYPAEVQPLVDDLNAVLADNARLVEQARRQTGNLAHALKTPLAVVGNAAAHWPGDDGALVREQLAAMRRQLDLHLARARAAALAHGARRHGLRTPLAPVLHDLQRVLARLHPDRILAIDLPPDAAPAVAVAPEALQDLLGNLLDNACRWARSQVRVRVAAAGHAGPPAAAPRWRIDIDDDGPGIAPERRAEALQRGRRLDERQPGSGLGLAIADELASLHGGTLALGRADLGGLRATLHLPHGGAGATE